MSIIEIKIKNQYLFLILVIRKKNPLGQMD